MTNPELETVKEVLEKLTEEVTALRIAIVGSIDGKSPGLLQRVAAFESQQANLQKRVGRIEAGVLWAIGGLVTGVGAFLYSLLTGKLHVTP
jgi:hypothetical protein